MSENNAPKPQILFFSRDTLIPIGLLAIVIAPAITIAVWGATIQSNVAGTAKALDTHVVDDDKRVDEIKKEIGDIKNSQVAIGAKLDYITETLNDIKKLIR